MVQDILRAMTTPTIDFAMIEMLRGLRSGGEADPLIELTDAFVTGGQERLQELTAAMASGDTLAVRRAAHSLKGISGSIGAVRMSHLSADLEKAEPSTIDAARVQELQDEFEAVTLFLLGRIKA